MRRHRLCSDSPGIAASTSVANVLDQACSGPQETSCASSPPIVGSLTETCYIRSGGWRNKGSERPLNLFQVTALLNGEAENPCRVLEIIILCCSKADQRPLFVVNQVLFPVLPAFGQRNKITLISLLFLLPLLFFPLPLFLLPPLTFPFLSFIL